MRLERESKQRYRVYNDEGTLLGHVYYYEGDKLWRYRVGNTGRGNGWMYSWFSSQHRSYRLRYDTRKAALKAMLSEQ